MVKKVGEVTAVFDDTTVRLLRCGRVFACYFPTEKEARLAEKAKNEAELLQALENTPRSLIV